MKKILKSHSTGWIVVNCGIPVSETFAGTRRQAIEDCDRGSPGNYERGKRRGYFEVVKVRLVEAK